MMVLLAGTVTTVALPPVIEKCKTCGLPIGRCKYKGKHPAKQEPSKPKQETSKPKKISSNRSTHSSASNSLTQEQRRVLRELEDNMVWVEGGSLTMGATRYQANTANRDETPAHQVTLSGFYISKYEVTQELWQVVMGTTIRQQRDKAGASSLDGEGANYPMYYISWEECQTFISKLYSLTGKRYRLPTEAEWEYAARGGNRSNGYKYAGGSDLASVAWYNDNSSSTHEVGTKWANELGLYDMSGNLWEWCADWYGSYSSGSQTNPTGPSSGHGRVSRGGSWDNSAGNCRVLSRNSNTPVSRSRYMGLRLAL